MINSNLMRSIKFKAFCDSNRIEIIELLKNGELCACELLDVLNIGQSTLSHHMKILVDSKVVTVRKEGKWSHYQLNSNTLIELSEYLKNLPK